MGGCTLHNRLKQYLHLASNTARPKLTQELQSVVSPLVDDFIVATTVQSVVQVNAEVLIHHQLPHFYPFLSHNWNTAWHTLPKIPKNKNTLKCLVVWKKSIANWILLQGTVSLLTNYHQWRNRLKPTLFLHHSAREHRCTAEKLDWPHLRGLRGVRVCGGYTKGSLTLSGRLSKKWVVSLSENHALVWLDLLGIKWSFDKTFNG